MPMQIHLARNGQSLGVFNEDQVREGIAQGSFHEADLAWQEGMTDWKPLSELFPENEEVVLPPPVPVSPVAPVTVMSSSKSSGLAIASLVCGILSFLTCGLTGFPGIICGHMALSRIRKSMGAIGGKGLAIAGLITSYFGFLIVGVSMLAAIALPTFAKIQEKGRQVKSINNASQITSACRLYASDHEGRFPGDLEELLKEGVISDDTIFRDPMSHDGSRIGYDYFGANMKDTDQPDKVLLMSKSTDSRGRKVVARIDGFVEVVAPPLEH